MAVLQVFFDYACPYCLRAHEFFAELQGVQIEWMPCEAHPRPDRYGPHSDLVIQGMFLARDTGVNLAAYHKLAYDVTLHRRVDVERPAALAKALAPLVPPEAFLAAVQDGSYRAELCENNRLAWQTHDFSAVPSCAMGGKTLVSVEDVGLTRAMITEFVATRNK